MMAGEKQIKQTKAKKLDYHDVMPANFIDLSNTFCTRTFMIRYADELVELEDICQMKTEFDFKILDKKSGESMEPFYMDVGLYFYDLPFTGFPDFICEEVQKVFFFALL